jgi:DNA-binding PucR family transcriptional regulator
VWATRCGQPQPGLADAHRSAHQARIALRTVRQVREFGGVGVWSELGEYAVLAQLPPEALEDSPVDEPIERLSEGDPSGRLRQTLLTFLDHAGSIPRTADSLHLHRTSLYYRLNQISRLTGVDLDDGRTRFRLQLALRLADLRRTQH